MPRQRGRSVRWAVAAYAVVWAVNRSLRRVTGPSMRPTLEPGDLVLVRPVALGGIRRGAVVVVPDPREPRRRTIKRVAALPGGHVELRGEPRRLGATQLAVLGDDPTASTDSRVFGPVAAADVLAVVVAVVWPPRRLRPPA